MGNSVSRRLPMGRFIMLRNFAAVVSAVVLVILSAFVLGSASCADDEGAAIGLIDVSSIAATPARAGETTKITFTIENRGADRDSLLGVELAGQGPSRLMGSLGSNVSGPIGVCRWIPATL
jgi:hypothetical protein